MNQPLNANYDIEVFFDGACPLCKRDIAFLKRRDHQERIRLTDIADANFQAKDYGIDFDTLMAKLHGRLPNGQWVYGVDVFRYMYSALGFGRLVRFSRLGPVRWLLDLAYELFAKNRLRLTGRCQRDVCQHVSTS